MERTNRTPKVTVIMPAYNAARFIEEAIMSVVNQTFTDWELLVIDDGSKDETVRLAEKFAQNDERIKVFCNEKNMGVARTRNRGFDLAKGQWIALLDSDDVWMPKKLEKQLELAEETGADIVYCSYGIVDENGERVKNSYITRPEISFDDMLRENYIGCSTAMLSRCMIEKYHFVTDFYHEDYVMWTQILRDGYKANGLEEVLVNWRYMQNSRSFNKIKSAQNRWLIYRKYLKLPLKKSVKSLAKYVISGVKKYWTKGNSK